MFDERLFRSKVVYNGITLGELASKLEINQSTLTKKLKDGSFNRQEISRVAEVLHLSDDDVINIFFAEELEKTQL